ncbi:MAG: hypothetical protein QOK15_774 [Nocardioidaceae bacterium]|nr:hypothetical protein [Nocardioidaceae bacterium]
MTVTLPEPGPRDDAKALFLEYLDFYRATIVGKISGLDDETLRSPAVPSGWSPIELVKHLAFMERRWLRWGFLGEHVDDPWGDHGRMPSDDPEGDRWSVSGDESRDDVVEMLLVGGAGTRAAVEAAELSDPAATGGRFPEGEQPPTLLAILFHVLQEYARHTGHLDVARELIDGTTGE